MISISDILKTFLFKLYVFVAVFLIVFLSSYVHSLINNKPTIIDKGTYISSGELAVSFNSTGSLDTYMNNVIHRSKNDHFAQYVVDEISKELTNNTNGFFSEVQEELEIINKITTDDIKNNLNIEKIEGKTIFLINYSNKNAKVAQAVNNVIIKSIETILQNDTENILGGSSHINGVDLGFSIDKTASLPTSLSNSVIANGESMSILKVILISGVVYLAFVIIYDFIIGFITSRQKAKIMVQLDLISEIEVPYFKNRKNMEEN